MRTYLAAAAALVIFPGSLQALDLPEEVSSKLAKDIVASLAAEPAFADTGHAGDKSLYVHWATKGDYADDVATTITTVGPGLFREEIVGKSDDGAMSDLQFSTLGGLLPLVMEFDGGSDGAVLSDYEVDGAVFPLAPGNAFTVTWEYVFMGTDKTFTKQTYECEVKGHIDAAQFKADLPGKAFEVECDVELLGQDVGTEIYYYLVDAGYFVADHGRSSWTTLFEIKLQAQ